MAGDVIDAAIDMFIADLLADMGAKMRIERIQFVSPHSHVPLTDMQGAGRAAG